MVVVVLALGGTAGVLLHAHFSATGHPAANQAKLATTLPPVTASPSSPSDTSSASDQPSGSPDQSSGTSEQAAAQALANLLAQSASDRSSVRNAVADAGRCGDLSSDQQVFQGAVSSRQQLLSQLASLPGASTLPAQLTQALAGAWQASMQADQDFEAWVQDESSNGCGDSSSDSNYQAASAPDDQATADKTTFVNLWNPIAGQYGLQTYQEDQL